MIEAQGLSKYFGPVHAIEDVSFTVAKGEILGFLGPNAAGKTTTMRVLTCYFPPHKGTAKVAGYDILEQSLEVRRHVGYMPENVPLYYDMPVSSYLDFVAQVKGVDPRERSRHITEIMERCGLTQVREDFIGKLSRGYRQRVGLAQALINYPEVLILDEPTVGLDPKQIIEIRNLIKSLTDKSTIILSTHILPEASMICGRVIIINEGKIVAVDKPANLTSRLQEHLVLQLQIEGPDAEVTSKLQGLQGVLKIENLSSAGGVNTYRLEADRSYDVRKEIPMLIARNSWSLYEMKAQELSLEDIYLKLVTEENHSLEQEEDHAAHS